MFSVRGSREGAALLGCDLQLGRRSNRARPAVEHRGLDEVFSVRGEQRLDGIPGGNQGHQPAKMDAMNQWLIKWYSATGCFLGSSVRDTYQAVVQSARISHKGMGFMSISRGTQIEFYRRGKLLTV